VSRGDPPREELRLRSEPVGLPLEEHGTSQLTVANIVERGFTPTRRDALGDNRLGERLEATLAAACAMLDVRIAELEQRIARLEELLADPLGQSSANPRRGVSRRAASISQ
jgi:hypothetical protein